MICFQPDGSILCKVNLCSCADCILGNFLDCVIEPGKIFSAEEDDDVFGDEIDDMNEKYELRSNSVLEVISVNDVIALIYIIRTFLFMQSFEFWYSRTRFKG